MEARAEMAEEERKAERATRWRLELAEARAHPFHLAKILPARARLRPASPVSPASAKTEYAILPIFLALPARLGIPLAPAVPVYQERG